MRTTTVPSLLTPGRIADALGVPLPRVLYILATRRHILPAARAGTLRLYDTAAVVMVRHELHAIDARRSGRGANMTPDTPPAPLAVPARDAARMLSISERALWSLTAPRGPIPCIRLGRSVRYSVAVLQRYLETGRAEP